MSSLSFSFPQLFEDSIGFVLAGLWAGEGVVIRQLTQLAFVVETESGGYIMRGNTWLKVEGVVVVSVVVSDVGCFGEGPGSERKPGPKSEKKHCQVLAADYECHGLQEEFYRRPIEALNRWFGLERSGRLVRSRSLSCEVVSDRFDRPTCQVGMFTQSPMNTN